MIRARVTSSAILLFLEFLAPFPFPAHQGESGTSASIPSLSSAHTQVAFVFMGFSCQEGTAPQTFLYVPFEVL